MTTANNNQIQSAADQEMQDLYQQAMKYSEAGDYEAGIKVLEPGSAAKAYGDIVYWGTVLSAFIALVGQILNFIVKDFFYIDPSYTLSAIWEEKLVGEIWEGAIGTLPNGHWYLSQLATGDGLTCFGLAFGVFIVIPALIISGFMLFQQKSVFFGVLAMIAAAITIASMLGLIPLPLG